MTSQMFIPIHRKILFVLTCIVITAGCAGFEGQSKPAAVPEIHPGILAGYLQPEALPNSLALIPPPPAKGSAALALDEEISWELLQFLGELNHPATKQYRYWLLKRMLKSGSHWKRDGASLGLDLMDDPEALISIKQAIEMEQIQALRLSMEKVLARLESRK